MAKAKTTAKTKDKKTASQSKPVKEPTKSKQELIYNIFSELVEHDINKTTTQQKIKKKATEELDFEPAVTSEIIKNLLELEIICNQKKKKSKNMSGQLKLVKENYYSDEMEAIEGRLGNMSVHLGEGEELEGDDDDVVDKDGDGEESYSNEIEDPLPSPSPPKPVLKATRTNSGKNKAAKKSTKTKKNNFVEKEQETKVLMEDKIPHLENSSFVYEANEDNMYIENPVAASTREPESRGSFSEEEDGEFKEVDERKIQDEDEAESGEIMSSEESGEILPVRAPVKRGRPAKRKAIMVPQPITPIKKQPPKKPKLDTKRRKSIDMLKKAKARAANKDGNDKEKKMVEEKVAKVTRGRPKKVESNKPVRRVTTRQVKGRG